MTLSNAEKARRAAARVARANAQMHPTNNAEAGATSKIIEPSRSGATVTVACKIGISWLDLQICKKVEKWENTQNGPRKVEEFVRQPGVERIRGTSYPRGIVPDGFPPAPELVGGFALTRNVSADFWRTWVEQNSRNPYVMNNLLFAAEKEDEVKARALELSGLRSGLEPLDVKGKDPRMPRPATKALEDIQTAERA